MRMSKQSLGLLFPKPIASEAMPRPLDPAIVKKFAEAFKAEPKLSSCGFSFLMDITGKLFKKAKVNLKDINGNTEAWLAVSTKYKKHII